MSCAPETVAALEFAARKANGQHVPDEIFQHEPLATQIAYGRGDNATRNALAEVANDPKAQEEMGLLQAYGAVKSWIHILQDAQPVIGEHFTQPLLDALQEHWEATHGQDPESYKMDILPVIDDLRQEVAGLGNKDAQAFANDWLDFWEDGGRLYRAEKKGPDTLAGKIGNIVMYPIRTAAGNLVVNNPFIASAHILQVVPKGVAYYGPRATLEGLLSHLSRSGEHKLLGEDPELAARGIYRNHESGFNLVNFGDNLAKGISYRIGEAAGKDPIDAVQNIAYQYRLGREPMITWHTENAAQVYLMRFAIESSKMYGGWLRNIAKGVATGDLKLAQNGAMALAGFSIAQSAFTGVKSAVPAFLYPLLPDDIKQKIDQVDQSPFVNVAGHATGRDFTHYQPAGGFSLGIGADLVNTDLKGGYSHTRKALESFTDQDYTRAGVEFGRALFSAGQPLVPGVRITYKKLFDVLGDQLTGEKTSDEAPEETLKALGFPAVGE